MEYVFDHGKKAFPGRSFTCDSFVAHFLIDGYFMPADISVHDGVITFASGAKISSVSVDYFTGLDEVYLAVMNVCGVVSTALINHNRCRFWRAVCSHNRISHLF